MDVVLGIAKALALCGAAMAVMAAFGGAWRERDWPVLVLVFFIPTIMMAGIIVAAAALWALIWLAHYPY